MSEKPAKAKSTKSTKSSSTAKATTKKELKSFKPEQTVSKEQMIGIVIFFIVVTIASSYAFLNTFSIF